MFSVCRVILLHQRAILATPFAVKHIVDIDELINAFVAQTFMLSQGSGLQSEEN